MKILTQNSKMRKTASARGVSLWNFGIPAFKSKTGLRTCPNAGACASGCYAQSGTYRFSNVASVYEARLALTLQDDFVLIMGREIESKLKTAKGKRVMIRVHDSGDFYSPAYQLAWYHIAKAFPEVYFYAYTKQVAQSVALSGVQPLNFTLIYSYGGKQDNLIQSTDRHSRVFESLEALESAGYIDGTHDDLVAPLSPNPRIGLVYHHAKSYDKTLWSQVTG